MAATPKTQNQDQVWPWYHWAQKGDLGALFHVFFHNLGVIYSLVHLKNAHIVHMTWNPLWLPPKMAKMTNKANFGIIEPRRLIFVCNSMFVSVIYSLVHLKCTQNSHDLKSNMATIESPKMLSLINWYSSKKIVPQIKWKAKCDGWGNEMCCKNSNKAVAWSMFRSVSYGVSFPQTIQAVQVDGAQLWWGLSSPLGKDCPFWSGFMPVVRMEQHGVVVSFLYLPIIDMNPTSLNCIYSTLWFAEDIYPGQTGWLSYHHEWS